MKDAIYIRNKISNWKRNNGLLNSYPFSILSKKYINKLLESMIFIDSNYLNYNPSLNINNKSHYRNYGILANKIKHNTNGKMNQFNSEIYCAVKTTNTNESTRTSNSDINAIVKYFCSLKINDFKKLIENRNEDYKIISDCLNTTHKHALSLLSKVCFHCANAIFGNDCNFSKYDNIVKQHIYIFSNNAKVHKHSFDKTDYKTYCSYCREIKDITKRFGISRNGFDLAVWLNYK